MGFEGFLIWVMFPWGFPYSFSRASQKKAPMMLTKLNKSIAVCTSFAVFSPYSFNCGENWHDPVKCKVSISEFFVKCVTLNYLQSTYVQNMQK